MEKFIKEYNKEQTSLNELMNILNVNNQEEKYYDFANNKNKKSKDSQLLNNKRKRPNNNKNKLKDKKKSTTSKNLIEIYRKNSNLNKKNIIENPIQENIFNNKTIPDTKTTITNSKEYNYTNTNQREKAKNKNKSKEILKKKTNEKSNLKVTENIYNKYEDQLIYRKKTKLSLDEQLKNYYIFEENKKKKDNTNNNLNTNVENSIQLESGKETDLKIEKSKPKTDNNFIINNLSQNNKIEININNKNTNTVEKKENIYGNKENKEEKLVKKNSINEENNQIELANIEAIDSIIK